MRSDVERGHTTLATALDLIAIGSGAAAVVLLFGARHSFLVGSVFVRVPDELPLAIFAALAAAIRLAVEPRLRLLPALPVERIQTALDAERKRFADPPRATPDVKYYALIAAMSSLLWVSPHLANIRHVPDAGDPVFSAWRLARFSHQLLNEPTRLFDGNIFHPARHTLTYSDATVLEGLAALPFLAAGADPLVVSNALFLASFPLSALAFFYAGWRLTSDPQAAAIGGILGGLSSFKMEHYSHLELQFFCFAPLSIVALMRLLAAPSWRTGAIFGAMVSAQWLACMYFGVMLLVFLAPMVVLLAAAWRVRPTRGLAVATVTCVAVVVGAGSIIAIPYLRSQNDRGERSFIEVRPGSARPSDYVAATGRLVTYEKMQNFDDHRPERELFPGSAALVLASVALAPPFALGKIILFVGTAAAFDGSLGTNGLIYDELYTYVLPFRGMRVPARFAAMVSTGLFLLAAFGARQVFRLGRTHAQRIVLFTAVAALALVDLRAQVSVRPVFSRPPPIYSQVTRDMVLAELPMGESSMLYMYFSTFHWARLINGYSGYMPAYYMNLEAAMADFPTPDLVQRLRQLGATHLTVNCRLYTEPARCAEVLQAIDQMPDFQLISSAIWEAAEVRLYALRESVVGER